MITGTANKIKSQVQASMKELESLEAEAAKLRDAIEAHESARERNHATETHIAALESERDGLKGEYAEASFEGDTERLGAAQSRREAIDSELSELQPVDVPELDGFALAELKYRAEQSSFAYVEELVRMVRDELESLKSGHHERKRAIVSDLSPYITTDDATAVKKHYRPGYKTGEELREESIQKQREENIRNYGTPTPDFNDTGAMTKAMMNARAKRQRLANA